jgi:hypothetical protein
MTAERHGRFELTAEQSEALVVAVDHGYFDVPRGATMDDLATEPGVSRQAIPERLRRAHEPLIRSTMAIGHEADGRRKQSWRKAVVSDVVYIRSLSTDGRLEPSPCGASDASVGFGPAVPTSLLADQAGTFR